MQATDCLNILIHEEHITREEVEATLSRYKPEEPIELTDEEWLYLANHISEGIQQVGTGRATGFDYLHLALHWFRTN